MEWYREELPLIRELIIGETPCGHCGRPLIEEGHQSVCELRVEQPDTPLKTLVPNFKLFFVYLLQCACGAWFHADCLMPLQKQTVRSVDGVHHGVNTPGLAQVSTIVCPCCGQTLWEITSKGPNPWTTAMPIRLPAKTSYFEFARTYEVHLRPHLTGWPSLALRLRVQDRQAITVYPYPRDGQLPSAGMIAQNRVWHGDGSQVVHRIAKEICTNDTIIQEALGDHIAQRERQRVERGQMDLSQVAQRPGTPSSSGTRKGLFGWMKK